MTLKDEVFQSVIDNTVAKPDGGNALNLIQWLARTGISDYAWWSPSRDMFLRNFWKQSDHLSGAVYTMCSKISAIPVHVQAKDNTDPRQVAEAEAETERLLSSAELGEGWQAWAEKFVEDLITQDNGGFSEIIGAGSPDGPIIGRPISVRQLDSSRSQRTGNPEYPVIYRHTDGKMYKLHYTRVIYRSQMTSPIAEMYGVGFCLDAWANVTMADGTTRRIMDIVNEKSADPVLSMDENGNLVPRRVTNWYKNPRGGRAMICIMGKLSKTIRGRRERKSWVTEDHPVLTPSGWTSAGDLETGDEIVTAFPYPNENQMQFIVGTLLGDGSLMKSNAGGNPVFAMGHSEKQREWFEIKAKILRKDFGFYQKDYTTKQGYKTVRGATRGQPAFMGLHKLFYGSGKKEIPMPVVEESMSHRLLAAWYLDDGCLKLATPARKNTSPTATIATLAFSLEQTKEVCGVIREKMGYDARPSSNGGGQYVIRFTVDSSEKFFKDIAPFVPPSMRHKLPGGGKIYGEYDPKSWELGGAVPMVDTVIVERKADAKVYRCGKKNVYCIDVEEAHNFVTSGIVVHNCAISRAMNVAQNLVDILIYKQERLGSRPYRGVMVTGGGLDPTDIREAFSIAAQEMDSQGLSRYSKIAVVGSSSIPDASLNLTDIAGLPDNFDERTSVELGIATIAMAFGMDARELFPALASGATRADALIQHLKQRGKGPGQIIQMIELMFNQKYLPPYLQLVFDYQDDEQDRQSAEVKQIRAQGRGASLGSGEIDIRTARQQMVEVGDLSRGQFDYLELQDGRLPDGTSVLGMFEGGDQAVRKYLEIPGLPDPLSLEADPQIAITAITKQLMVVQGEAIDAKGRNKIMTNYAIAALNALMKEYEKLNFEPAEDEVPPGDGGEESDTGPERDPRIRRVNPTTIQREEFDVDELEPDNDEERVKGAAPQVPFWKKSKGLTSRKS